MGVVDYPVQILDIFYPWYFYILQFNSAKVAKYFLIFQNRNIFKIFLPLLRENFILSYREPFRRSLQGTPAGSAIGAVVEAGSDSAPEGFVMFVAGVGGCGIDAATAG